MNLQKLLQIDSLRDSINSLKEELHTDKNGTIFTRLDIIFMSSAAFDFASLDPSLFGYLDPQGPIHYFDKKNFERRSSKFTV